MTNRNKIIIVLIVLAIGGFVVYNFNANNNEPKIELTSINKATKEVAFKMSYKDKKFATTVKLGGIRQQVLGDYTFQAITQGQNIVLSIKDKSNKVLKTKTVSFE